VTPGLEGDASEKEDQEEQSALELIWAIRTSPPVPEGASPDPPREADGDDLGPPARQLGEELRERRRQLVELLSRHLGQGALAIPAILARLSPEERTRLDGLLEGRTIAEVLGTADLFRLDLE
jgi:hypothetical protein